MADNKINVGGRLHSIATGNVLAGADEILDDNKGKKQSEVNIDVDNALADRYTKDETYNKNELNNLITTPETQYVTVAATEQTTAVTDVLPATGAGSTVYRVGNWDGSQFDASAYSEYAWNGGQYIHLSTKTKIGEVFDISAYHATGGTLATYADLSAALDSNNGGVPQSLQKGGMSIKFVQSSDNKYVQYRLMADEFTTDITQWAIAEEGVYVENPEFVYVKTDAEDKILWAIRTDGDIFYGVGVPSQVVNYINKKIAELSLDEYEDIVAFLNDLEKSDKTLQTLLNEKVDKEEGKSLIDADYAEGVHYIENPEFIRVYTDNDNRILWAIKTDGSIEWAIGIPTPVKEYIDNAIAEIKNGTEGTNLDGLNKIIAFLSELSTSNTLKDLLDTKVDKELGKGLIQDEVAEGLSVVEEPEFMDAEIDSEGKILGGRKANGTKIENVGFETPSVSIGGTVEKMFNDPENRRELLLDSEERIVSYRKEDGTKVEDSIEVNNLSVRNINFGEGARNSIKELIKILPSYYFEDDYINKRVLSIQTAIMQMGRGDIFGFLTDTHPMNKDNVNSGRILQYIASQTPMQKVLFGGDIGPTDATYYGADTKALEGLARSVMQQTERIYNPCREAGCEIYIARGNHDFASTDNAGATATGSGYLVNRKATRQTLFAYCDTNKIVTNDEDENAMYYYFDNELQKIRYIVVDTSDNQTDAFNPQSVRSNVATQIGNTQIQWIVENAILTTPNDYVIVFMGHIVPAKVAYGVPNSYVWNDTDDKKSLRNLVSIIDAVQTNSSVTIDLMGGGTYTCNFESFVPKVLLYIAGHIHFDTQSYSNGCMYYMSGADLFTQQSVNFPRVEKQLFGLVFQQREYNSITENLVNVIIVDITNNKIRLFRIGSGVDKIFNTDTRELSTGSTLTLNSELNGNLKWKSYDATIFGPSDNNMFSHTITSVDENTGVVTGITAGESVVVAYSETDNSIEFFDIKVL